MFGPKLPKLADSDHVAQLVAQIRKYKIDVLIIDPLYLCLLSGQKNIDATNMFEIGPVFADFAEQIRAANCTLVLVHHTTKCPASQAGYRKGKEREPLELSDLAYAGVDQFCRQWILLNHREPFDPDTGDFKLWMSVGGSVGHSGQFALDIKKGTLRYDVSDPKCIDADFSDIKWATTVRTRTEQQTLNELETKKRTAAVERKKAEKNAGQIDRILGVLKKCDGLTQGGIRKALAGDGQSISGEKMKTIIEKMVERGLIEKCKTGNRKGIRLTTVDDDDGSAIEEDELARKTGVGQ